MPKFADVDMDTQSIGGTNYSFSGVRIDSLGASEYTLAVIALDVSGSTAYFRRDMEKALKSVVEACRKSPRADNLLLRTVAFDTDVQEIHGFKPLADCSLDSYDGCLGDYGGATALYDSLYTSVQSAAQYGKTLTENDFSVNAAVFVVTDGADNASKVAPKMVKEALQGAVTGESVESMVSVLVGLNDTGSLGNLLQQVKSDCGFTQYVGIKDASPNQIAKLGNFISRSVSSQSQALGTGGPSQSLSF